MLIPHDPFPTDHHHHRPNWFERNQTKSIILYTLTIMATTWAFSKFILNDREIAIARAQLETAKQQTEQYITKVNIIEKENLTLRDENKLYRTWLTEKQGSIPFYENRIKILEATVRRYSGKKTDPVTVSDTARVECDAPYTFARVLKKGEAFIDSLTQVSIGVSDMKADPPVLSGIINLPQSSEEFTDVAVGKRWDYLYREQEYFLMVEKMNWFANEYGIKVGEVRE